MFFAEADPTMAVLVSILIIVMTILSVMAQSDKPGKK